MAKDELVGNMDTEKMIDYFEEENRLTGVDRQALSDSLKIAETVFV